MTPELGNEQPKAITVEPKVYATLECRWCNINFEDYQITCMRCGCCQYCGTVNYGQRGCSTCGNKLPDDIEPPREHKRVLVT